MTDKLVYAGARTVMDYGDSVVVSLPKRELRELGHDPDDLVGQNVMTTMDEKGQFSAKMPDSTAREVLTTDAD